jgi:hypothetical protein
VGKINWSRVILGGLLAGLVLNVVDFVYYGMVMKEDMAAAMQAFGKQPIPASMISVLLVWDFVMGIGLVWLYAAIRPRFGAGVKTAVIAGLALWFFIELMSAIGTLSALTKEQAPMGPFPERLYTIGAVVALIKIPLACVAGAYFYTEA